MTSPRCVWTNSLHEQLLLKEGHVFLVLALHRAVLLLVDLLQLLQTLWGRGRVSGWTCTSNVIGPYLLKLLMHLFEQLCCLSLSHAVPLEVTLMLLDGLLHDRGRGLGHMTSKALLFAVVC